jgi:glycosyltransferase involved in cell wall biosynthesis
MAPAPSLSVLMPVYNAERYLAKAVESILAQTFTGFEFIIIEDGSTDGSRAILEQYSRRDDRIRLVCRPNTGLTIALNEALGLANAELIARMDADDISLPRRFELQVDYLRHHPECVVVGSSVLLIDSDGDSIRPFAVHCEHEDIDAAHLCGLGGTIVHPAALMRRDPVVEMGGYRPEMEPAEDLDLFLRLAERGRLANLPDTLLKYRRHASSVGYRRREEQRRAVDRVVREASLRRGQEIPRSQPAVDDPIESPPDHYRTWAWWALRAGYVATARKHALATLRCRPFSPESWRVAYCSIRGR